MSSMVANKVSQIEKLLNATGIGSGQISDIPTIYDIWEVGQGYLKEGRPEKARQCELLIRFLYNSFVSINLRLGSDVAFAYGGIGIVIHKDAEIGSNVMIGQGVTIGGAPGTARRDATSGAMVSYPKINDFVYISAGARVIGGIEVGAFSIIGANAVLKKSVPPFSVCAGVPVREIKPIEPSNFLKYKGMWSATKKMTDADYLDFIGEQYRRLLSIEDPRHSLPVNSAEPLHQDVENDFVNALDELGRDEIVRIILESTLDSINQDFGVLDNFTLQEDGGLLVQLPFTKATFSVAEDGHIDWSTNFDEHAATNKLFFYSLQWVGHWLCSFESTGDVSHLNRATSVLRSYYNFLSIGSNEKEVMQIRSSDHSVSIRVRVLVKYLHVSKKTASPDIALQRIILRNLLSLAQWLFDPANFKKSNHGLMGAIALLHVAAQVRHFESLASRYTTCASERILDMAKSAFDQDGYCNENTIGYHRFNTTLYESVNNFTRTYAIAEHLSDELSPIVGKAKKALQLLVWQDGTIPPIGDSPVYENVCSSIDRSSRFQESGLLVIKNNDLYLSLVCGSRSWIHKQCDDSSITLRYKGQSLLIDAGHFTHDHEDPYRLSIAGQRGHSGIFLEQCDDVLRERFMKEFGPYNASITSFEEDTVGARATCVYAVSNKAYVVERTVEVFWPDEILIRDHVTVRDGGSVAARQRFIFDPAIQVVEMGSMSLLRGPGMEATLFHLSPSTLDWYRAEPAPAARGWCSFKFGKLLETAGLDFIQAGTALSFSTVIKLAAIRDMAALSPALHRALAVVPLSVGVS